MSGTANHTDPVLIGCSHGTRSQNGQRVVAGLIASVTERFGIETREAFVDVQEPRIGDVVAALATSNGLQAVVVPLLMSGGYHVNVDIAQAVADRVDVVAAPPLGPDVRVLEIVVDRLREAHVPAGATVVLAAAGSTDARSQADVEAAAIMLRAAWDGPVRIGYAANIEPTVAGAVASTRESGDDVVAVASYLLAPGHFQDKLADAGGDHVTGPLAPDARLVQIIADRYRSMCGR